MDYFGKWTEGPIFQLFSIQHIIPLLLFLALNLSFIWLRKLPDTRWRKIFRWTLAIVLLVDEFLWHLWNATTGQWTLQTTLPLHLCSVFVFLSAFMLITRNYTIYEFAYFLGIAGALQAMLTPDLGVYHFPHFRYFQVFISHGSIITAAVYMTVVEGFRPTWKSFLKVAVIGNLYMLVVFGINTLIGSNYMFVNHKPETASLMDMLGPWPQYLLWLEVIGFGMFLILYLPFWISDLRKRRILKLEKA